MSSKEVQKSSRCSSDYTEVSEAEFRANFVGKKSASIKRLGELIGYIPVSKYDADLVSQKQLVEDLYALWGTKLVATGWIAPIMTLTTLCRLIKRIGVLTITVPIVTGKQIGRAHV